MCTSERGLRNLLNFVNSFYLNLLLPPSHIFGPAQVGAGTLRAGFSTCRVGFSTFESWVFNLESWFSNLESWVLLSKLENQLSRLKNQISRLENHLSKVGKPTLRVGKPGPNLCRTKNVGRRKYKKEEKSKIQSRFFGGQIIKNYWKWVRALFWCETVVYGFITSQRVTPPVLN